MDISNKENTFRIIPAENLKQNDRSTKTNQRSIHKQRTFDNSAKAHPQAQVRQKVKRLPLGGKDQNSALPQLQRSRSSTFAIGDSKLQRKRLLTSKLPLVSRSNSSLGFFQNHEEESSDAHDTFAFLPKSDQLSYINAQRSAKLITRNDTDSLVKHEGVSLPETSSLSDTVTNITNQLSSKYLPEVSSNFSDPIKELPVPRRINRSKASSSLNEKLIEQLANDPHNIEHIPSKKTSLPYTPVGFEFLPDEQIIKFLETTNSEKIEVKPDLISDPSVIDLDYNNIPSLPQSEDDDSEKDLEHIGMNLDDLKGLIDL